MCINLSGFLYDAQPLINTNYFSFSRPSETRETSQTTSPRVHSTLVWAHPSASIPTVGQSAARLEVDDQKPTRATSPSSTRHLRRRRVEGFDRPPSKRLPLFPRLISTGTLPTATPSYGVRLVVPVACDTRGSQSSGACEIPPATLHWTLQPLTRFVRQLLQTINIGDLVGFAAKVLAFDV